MPEHPPDPVDPSSAAPGYAAAMAELEDLLADLEDDALDIDLLATKVERASELIRFCRSRINAARVQVDRIVADLENLPDEQADDPRTRTPATEPDDFDDPDSP
jgi:exodeoxyribonuclease VII small subunit